MKKFSIASFLICIMLVSILCAYAESSTNERLLAFMDEVSILQENTGFLTDPNGTDMDMLQSLIEKYELCPPETGFISSGYKWLDLEDVFYYAWGSDTRFWTMEQSNQMDTYLVSLGMQWPIYHVLPTADEVSPEQALLTAKQELTKAFAVYDDHPIDFDEYLLSMQYIKYPYKEDPIYLIQFYNPTSDSMVYSIDLDQDGVVSLSYYIPNPLRDLYEEWRHKRSAKTFSLWSVEDKAAFYECLLQQIDMVNVSSEEYPQYAKEVLKNVHGLPSPEHITEEQACQSAIDALVRIDIDVFPFIIDETIGVSFLKDESPVYVVRFYNGIGFHDFQYAVEVDPITGEATVMVP